MEFCKYAIIFIFFFSKAESSNIINETTKTNITFGQHAESNSFSKVSQENIINKTLTNRTEHSEKSNNTLKQFPPNLISKTANTNKNFILNKNSTQKQISDKVSLKKKNTTPIGKRKNISKQSLINPTVAENGTKEIHIEKKSLKPVSIERTNDKEKINIPNVDFKHNDTNFNKIEQDEIGFTNCTETEATTEVHTPIKNFVYTIIDNNQSKIDTEVPDLLNTKEISKNKPIPNETKEFNETVVDRILLLDRLYTTVNGTQKKLHNESAGLIPGKLAAILAGVFLVVALIGYVIMLSWRRYLENRYGNREILTDEDYCDKMTDLDHFSI